MSDPFVGEIRMFAGNFAPQSWAFCDGQLLAVNNNNALFSLFGTLYGGDGRTTFGLPDLRGRIPLHMGTGPGLSPRAIGSKAGDEKATVGVNELAGHSHAWQATSAAAQERTPIGNAMAETAAANIYSESEPPQNPVTMAAGMVTNTGGSQSHENIQPFQCIHYIVALFGIYPSRN